MKQAVVINVGHGAAALKHAVDTQMLLLDRLGGRLDSIRLAAPRLLHRACAAAIAEKPDVLVMVGGPRSSRRAGQLAHRHATPILFLPGFRAPQWARRLWGSLGLEDMVGALARGELRPVRLGVGVAGGQVFFEEACCGLLPHFAELRGAFEEAETIGETWSAVARATQLSRFLLNPNIRFCADASDIRKASALIVKADERNAKIGSWREAQNPILRCSIVQYGAFGLAAGLIKKNTRRERKEQFECRRLVVNAGQRNWVLLDGDPVCVDGDVEFCFIPGAIHTFMFNPAHEHANDNPKTRGHRFRSFDASTEPEWNSAPPSHVAFPDSRDRGNLKPRKRV